MKVEIIVMTVFLLTVANALPRDTETGKGSDGHTYTLHIGRNGAETISRDGKHKEVIIPMHEQGKWVLLTENDENNCYALDMTEEEKSDKVMDLDFESVDYEVVNVEEEVNQAINKTCEEHGGPGRDIIRLKPKRETDTSPVSVHLEGDHDGGIVKRHARRFWKWFLNCHYIMFGVRVFKFCRFGFLLVPC